MKKSKEVVIGTIRFKAKDLNPYLKTSFGWKRDKQKFSSISSVIRLYQKNHSLKILIDKKDPRFLKGQLSPEGQEQGARVNQLPDGAILDKAFNLFSPELVLHDQDSMDHWDVMYKNKGGTY